MALGKLKRILMAYLYMYSYLLTIFQDLPSFQDSNLAKKFTGELRQPYVKISLDKARAKIMAKAKSTT
jgi:hypothetical protein